MGDVAMDNIIVEDINGNNVEVELILTANVKNKKYLLYRNDDGYIFASYIFTDSDDDKLYNNLTDEEYLMLEKLYKKGKELYDK